VAPADGSGTVIWLLVAFAGALGSACRYVVDHVVTARTSSVVPWGTTLVNVSGSLVAGAVAGLASGRLLSADVSLVVGGGFLGAYTTFSTAMYETLRLWEAGARLVAVTYLLAPLLLAVAAATLGWWLVV
jgi:fluoride exporter